VLLDPVPDRRQPGAGSMVMTRKRAAWRRRRPVRAAAAA
jgi:hypothetical protein